MKKKRGRKTAGALEAVESIPVRPDPPEDMSDFSADIWRKTVNGFSAEWFGEETLPQLESYCEHLRMFEVLTQEVEDCWDELSPADKVRLLKQRSEESRAAMSAATKLRITKQATTHPEKKKNPGSSPAPWPMLNK